MKKILPALLLASVAGFAQQILTGTKYHPEQVDQPLYEVTMNNDSIAYAVGDSGLIVTNRTAPVTGLMPPEIIQDKLKIYPNPKSGLLIQTCLMCIRCFTRYNGVNRN